MHVPRELLLLYMHVFKTPGFPGSDDGPELATAKLGETTCTKAALPQAMQSHGIPALQCFLEASESKWMVAKWVQHLRPDAV